MRPEVLRARLRPFWATLAASTLGFVAAAAIIGWVALLARLDKLDAARSRDYQILQLEGDVHRIERDIEGMARRRLPVIEDIRSVAHPVARR